METYQTEAQTAAREIARAAEQMATTAAQELTPAVLERLGEHAAGLERALSEFRKGCDDARRA
jgi:hypothetical protein